MDYKGRYKAFDFSRIKTYPLAKRKSKVGKEELLRPGNIPAAAGTKADAPDLRAVADAVKAARTGGKPVILFTGAHIIKNGFGPLLCDLMGRKLVTLVAINAAAAIHDLELALAGVTSEDVPDALPRGEFGFAAETARLINGAFSEGERRKIGAGEALGGLVSGEEMPAKTEFPHRELSVLAAGHARGIPVTMHAGIGTDVIDSHASFDGAAKGGCSGRDFAIFCAEVEAMKKGGVFLNIGSAVTGPEVFLKACSMAANVGNAPTGVVTAVFDFQPADPADVDDESKPGYYRRDVKSVVVRIPAAFNGKGYYIQGDHASTVPALYELLVG